MTNISAKFSVKQQAALVLVCAVPALITLIFVIKFATNFPYADQWELVPFLKKIVNHQPLTLSDLASQHNEHRLLFPRLIMLGLASMTHWNTKYEMYFSYFLLVCIFAFLLSQLFRLYTQVAIIPHVKFAIISSCLLLSVLTFSVTQHDNLLVGWQLQIYLNILAVLFCLFMFSHKEQLTTLDFILAAVAGIIATYSFANGVLIWPIGFLVLLVRRQLNNSSFYPVLGWVILSIVILYLYLHNYQKPGQHPSLLTALYNPKGYVLYVLNYLGTPIVELRLAAVIPPYVGGAVGVVAICLLTYFLFKDYLFFNRVSLFWHGLLLYALLSAAITGIGRTGFGAEQAIVSRYVTISNLFWMWIIVFGVLIIAKHTSMSRPIISIVSIGFCLVIAYYTQGIFRGAHRLYTDRFGQGEYLLRNNLIKPTDNSFIYPSGPELIERNEFLRKEKLSFYYEGNK